MSPLSPCGSRGFYNVIKLPLRLMQSYWRRTRGLTLGAQGAVIDAQGRFLLVRHSYRPGWHFPGGGVERGEAIETALHRELAEEAGIKATGPVDLFGIYDHGAKFPGDHIALFLVRQWQQPRVPQPNAEIREQGFFAVADLPEGTTSNTRARMEEIAGRSQKSLTW